MKQKVFTAIEILFESIYFLVINYTLSSMSASFKPHWCSLLFQVVNVFACSKFYASVNKRTESPVWTAVVMILNLAAFALLAWNLGYIKGEFTPFPRF